MMFRKPFEPCKRSFISCAGSEIRPVYTLVNKHGERSLRHVDDINVRESINSYEDQTNIKNMLRRYMLSGDIGVLRKGGGYVYEDVSGVETNLAKVIETAREVALLKLQTLKADKAVPKSDEATGINGTTGAQSAGSTAEGGVNNE